MAAPIGLSPMGGGGGVSAVLRPNPRGVGREVQRGVDFFRVLGELFNSLFHSEHLEITQVRGGTIPFDHSPQMGGVGGGG